MAVDEFGREIPAGRGGRDGGGGGGSSPPPPRHHSYGGSGGGAGGPEDPSFLNEALPTSRYDGAAPPSSSSHHHHSYHGGGGGSITGGHHHQHQHHSSHHHNRHHSSSNNNNNNNGHYNSHHHNSRDSNDHNRRKRKNRDEDVSGPSSSSRGGGGAGGGGRKSSSSAAPHPCTLYAEAPMMCQFLWKESKGDNDDGGDSKDKDDNEDEREKDADQSPTKSDNEDNDNNSDNGIDGTTSTKSNAGYDEYRKGYCLNYIRMFFNQHLDDSWFRSLYSPLEEQRLALQERQRATQEAQTFLSELDTSMAKNSAMESSSSSKSPCFFILKARLGGGIKQATTTSSTTLLTTTSPLSSRIAGSLHSSSSLSNPVPGTHVSSLSHQVLPIQDVPPHVSDDQLMVAILSHMKPDGGGAVVVKARDLTLYSSSVPGNGNLFRTTYVHCRTEEIRKEIITQLIHINRPPTAAAAAAAADPTKGGSAPAAAASHVPRKEDTYVPKTLQLEVECSDTYGRTEFDADGKGGARAGADGEEEEGGVPPRKATVWISTQTAKFITPHVAVLSAAVSSKIHIVKDMKAARTIAKAYDLRRQIPPAARLEAILEKALPDLVGKEKDDQTEEHYSQTVEDALDLAIAYLRRVHLFSFYNGCACATRVGDVLNGTHPTSTIHLRLGIADEILQQAIDDNKKDTENTITNDAEPEEDAPEKVVDLLVQRHELYIDKALKQVQPWLDDPDTWGHKDVVLGPEKDEAAKAIQQDEQRVEPVWIEDHSLIDEDGRARCSFHFCRKLFKDDSFLKKHLLKKHSEFLLAERAKCHDQSMMEAWDAQVQRPVPPILVDCGRAFSLVPSPVLGADVPLAEDPEPELWRRQEERRQEEEQMRRERQERFQPPPQALLDHTHLDAPLTEERNVPSTSGGAPRPNHHFVDVDDMQEEKIELAFDNVEIPQPKKKKRKKKLL